MNLLQHILVCDELPVLREGVKSILQTIQNNIKVTEASNSKELQQALQTQTIDLLVLDIYQSPTFSLQDVYFVKDTCPQTKIVVLSSIHNAHAIKNLVGLGVDGILDKKGSQSDNQLGLAEILHGQTYYCQSILKALVSPLETPLTHNNLSKREIEITSLIAKGKSTKDLADNLNLSVHTIRTHKKNILKKLGLNTTAELIAQYYNEALA